MSLTRVSAAAAALTVATALAVTSTPAQASVSRAAGHSLGGNVISGDAFGRCSPMTSNQVSGTLLGRDGLAVNATVGFDFLDRSGHAIDARTGCPVSGYGAILQLNHYLPATGAPLGTEQVDARGGDKGPVTGSFQVLNLPADAATVFIETYSRRYTGSPCGLPCAGNTDTSKYGFVNRQRLPVGRATANLTLVADTTPSYGGDTGSIQLYIHRTNVTSIHAWSMAVKGNVADEGWGTGVRTSNPHLWTIPALSPGQEYTVIVGGSPQLYHIKVGKNRTTKVTTRF